MADRPSTKDILAAVRGQGGPPEAVPVTPKPARRPRPESEPGPAAAGGSMSVADKLAAIRGGGGGGSIAAPATTPAAPKPKPRPKPPEPEVAEVPSAPGYAPHPWPTLLGVVLLGWFAFTAGLLVLLFISVRA